MTLLNSGLKPRSWVTPHGTRLAAGGVFEAEKQCLLHPQPSLHWSSAAQSSLSYRGASPEVPI